MENQPTTRQVVLFTVVLSFIVSIIGTILTMGILGPLFITGDSGAPFVFNRPAAVLDKLISPPATSGAVENNNEDAKVAIIDKTSQAVVSVVASKDVPVIEQYYVDPFADDPLFKQFFGENGSGVQIPQYRQKGTTNKEVSAGTGFIISADGMIVTNKHVVTDASASYTVLLNDGRKMPAKVLARDPVQDLAVLKIEGNGFNFLNLGDSAQVKIGQSVIAIGNALGEFRNTVSVGIISGLQRSVVASGSPDGPEALQELIQTDAAINPGNSGGPLLNLKGEVIGINTAIAQGAQNIGFAIPINKVKRDITSVRATGRIVYPFLGVRYAVVTKDLADKEKLGRSYGALLRWTGDTAVVKDSPAAKAGLKDGDIILKINSDAINTEQSLTLLVQKYQVGEEITLRVWRDGGEMDVKVKLEERK